MSWFTDSALYLFYQKILSTNSRIYSRQDLTIPCPPQADLHFRIDPKLALQYRFYSISWTVFRDQNILSMPISNLLAIIRTQTL